MAWRFYTGVQENFPVTILPASGTTDNRDTSISDIPCGAIRLIYPLNAENQAKSHIQTLVNNGKYVIPTLMDHTFGNATDAGIRAGCQKLAAALDGLVDVVEFVNEPLEVSKGGDRNDPPANNRYLKRLDEAIPIFNAHGIKTLVGGNASSQNPMGMLADIDAYGGLWGRLGGVGFHPYFSTVGTNLSTGMFGYINSFRNKIDSYGANAAALPIYITEFGWGNEPPGGAPPNLLCDPKTGTSVPNQKSREADQAQRLTDSFNLFVAHAEALKVRAAIWFWLSDWDVAAKVYANCGLRTHLTKRSPTTGTRFKPSMAALGTFDPVYDLDVAKPIAITIAPPTGIGQHGATLKGRVNPQGLPTTWRFNIRQQGNTTWTEVGSGSAGSGLVNVDVQYAVGLLGAGLTWEYQVVATSSAGSDTGTVQTFSTTAAPTGPDVITGPATAITAHSATLTGDIDPKGLPATWHFEWGTDPTLAVHSTTPDRTLGEVIIVPGSHTLNVTPQGTGQGVVTSSPAGIDTSIPGGDSHDFPDGTPVTLTEVPTAPDTFGGWSGDGTGAGTTRNVTMSAARNVIATFTAPIISPGPWTLTVTKSGAGAGRVTSSPAGIDTNVGSSPWTHDFPDGTVVTLTETTSDTFGGWTGNGSGNGSTRTVTMSGNRAVNAIFNTAASIVADYYVTPSGSNINAGTSEGAAFATIDRARQAAGFGDIIGVKGPGTYSEAVQVTTDGVKFQGYGATPPIVSGGNTRAACFNLTGGTRQNVKIDGFEMKDIVNAGTSGAILGTAGAANCEFTNNVIHDVTGGGLTTSAGIHLERGAPGASHDNLIEGNLIFNIGVSNSVDTGEEMGIYCFAHRSNTYRNNTIMQVRKEGIRDYIGIQSTFEGNHFLLCWEGMTFNGGAGHLVRNNAFYGNEVGFSMKHISVTSGTSTLTDGGWTGLGYTPASIGYTRVWHNTFWGNLAADIDMGQGYTWDYADVRNNIFASEGDCRLRFFGDGQGHFTVDHNCYPNELGTTNFFQDATGFSMGGPFDSTFPLTTSNGGHNDGNQGLPWDTNGLTANPGFTGNLEDGDPAYSNTLTGANIVAAGGLGTQVGAVGIGPAAKSYKRYTASSASTTAGGTAARLIDGKWKVPNGEYLATAQSGTLTLDLGSSKSVNILTMHTEVSQTDAGIPQSITIATSPDNSTWTDSGLGTVTNVGTRGSSYKYRFASTRSARYVRMIVNSTHGANIRVMELEPGLVT